MKIESHCTAIQATTGMGKSRTTLKHAAEIIKKLRRNKDTRSVVVFVPTLKLAQELSEKFKDLFPDLDAECFIGLNNPNPNTPDEQMCKRSIDVNKLIKKGLSISRLCGSVDSKILCEYHAKSKSENPCGYTTQLNRHADIWFMTHQKLFQPKPKNIDPAAVVIDESFWEASISETALVDTESIFNVKISDNYSQISKELLLIIDNVSDGTLNIDYIQSQLSEHGEALCYKATKALDSFYKKLPISAETPSGEIDTGIDGVPNGSLRMFWRVLLVAFKANNRKTPYIKKKSTNGTCQFELSEKLYIHKDWNVKSLILDATLSTEIISQYFSNFEVQRFECPMVHTKVTQIWDKSLSKRMMLPTSHRSQAKNRELLVNLEKLISILSIRASNIQNGVRVKGYPGLVKILFITNKGIEEKLLAHPGFPDEVATMHYGAISGIDVFKCIPAVVIAGRLQLPLHKAENIGELLCGDEILSDPNQEYYPTRNRQLISNSQEITVSADYHPDPIVNAVRESKTEGEIIQAIGRARAIRRDENNPLEILILTNVPLPIPLDLITDWNSVVPTSFETLLSKIKVMPLAYNELKRMHPEQFSTIKKARVAVNGFYDRYSSIKKVAKSNLSAFLPIYSINREKGTQFQHYKELGLVRYTRNITGSKPCFAVIFDIEANEIEEALTTLVGELKSYRYICAFSADGEAIP
jgi:putative DNA primase/helicase